MLATTKKAIIHNKIHRIIIYTYFYRPILTALKNLKNRVLFFYHFKLNI